MISIKNSVVFFSFNFLFSSIVFSIEPYYVNSESLERIPAKYLSFLEGFDENTSFEVLENSSWSKKLKSAQSIVDGYWVKFAVYNNLDTEILGLLHNENREKKDHQEVVLAPTESADASADDEAAQDEPSEEDVAEESDTTVGE